jgi:hypothetical protein
MHEFEPLRFDWNLDGHVCEGGTRERGNDRV